MQTGCAHLQHEHVDVDDLVVQPLPLLHALQLAAGEVQLAADVSGEHLRGERANMYPGERQTLARRWGFSLQSMNLVKAPGRGGEGGQKQRGYA